MKTKILAATLCAAVLAAGCTKDTVGEKESITGKFTINATQTQSSDASQTQTRSSLENNVLKWTAADVLGVIKTADGSVNSQFTTQSSDISSDGKSAKFTGNALGAGNYTAYYPYKSAAPVNSAAPHVLTGQVQDANTTAHLGTYDFLFSDPVAVNQNETSKDFAFQHSLALLQIGFRVKTAGTNAQVKAVTVKAHNASGTAVNAFAQGIYYDPADGTVKAAAKGSEITLTVNNCPVLSDAQDNLTANLLVFCQAGTYPYTIDVVVTTDKNPVTFADARTITSAANEFQAGDSYATTLTIDALATRYFPDDNFRNYLVSLGFQLTSDGTDIDLTNPANTSLLQTTSQLNLNQYGIDNGLIGAKGYLDIRSLKGIELFTNLQALNISAVADGSNTADNLALKVDLSKNTKLTSLISDGAHLYPLDVSLLIDLATLHISNVVWPATFSGSINLEANTKLTQLYCDSSQLTALNTSKNVLLAQLHCQQNLLTSLDLSKNTALKELYCQKNLLTSLDISKNSLLTALDCGNQGSGSNLLNLNLKMTLLQQTTHWASWLLFGTNGLRVTLSIL